MNAGAIACGVIGLAAVVAAYLSKDDEGSAAFYFWTLAVFALIGAANS